MDTATTIYVILFFITMILLMILVSVFLQRRAVIAIRKIFHEKNALSAENAIEREELGIRHQHALFKKRDYKLQAVQVLMNIEIIQTTEAEQLYFSEEKLDSLRREGSKLVKILLPK